MRLKIDRPTKSVNSELFYTESGFSLVQEGEEFFLIGEATETQLLAAYEKHNPVA